MQQRTISQELILSSIRLRTLVTESFGACSPFGLSKTLVSKGEIISIIDSFQKETEENSDKNYFTSLKLFFKSLFQLIEAFQLQLDGKPGFKELLDGARLNANLFDDSLKLIDRTRPSITAMQGIANRIKDISTIQEAVNLVFETSRIAFATYISSETSRWGRNQIQKRKIVEESPEEKEKNLIISVRFYFDGETWANPQLIKPNVRYTLTGELKLNEWPEGYDKLVLSPVTTTDDSHYVLSLPEISHTTSETIPVQGSIIVKYPQPLFDLPMAIKIFARFTAPRKNQLYPLIIGYDQLILKALDNDSFAFPTGYSKLNKRAFEIISTIMQELPDLPKEELQHFNMVLSGILNYIGYCAEHSEYKTVTTLSEDVFRDNIIRYLSARSELAGSIVKESHIAGGRVEIRFKEIIVELKVERSVSDREKAMMKYEKQPVVYASATSAQLAILCILDLTPKTRPPAIANKNVFHRKVKVHGQTNENDSSHVVVVFIDGNIPNPSNFK